MKCFASICVWWIYWCNLFWIKTPPWSSFCMFTLLINDYVQFSMTVEVDWWFLMWVWLTLKKFNQLFSVNWGLVNLLVQFVLDKNTSMIIILHVYIADQWCFIIFHVLKICWWFYVSLTDFKNMKWTVFYQCWSGEFIGAICFG